MSVPGLLPVSTRDRVSFIPAAYDRAAAEARRAEAAAALGALWPDPADPASRQPGYDGARLEVEAAERHWAEVEKALDACGGMAPTYFLCVPTLRQKARFRAAIVAGGARAVGQGEVLSVLRKAIKGAAAPDQVDALIEIVDQFEAADDEADAGLRDDIAEIEAVMRQAWPPYARLLGEQALYLQVAPIVAAQHFLTGWENVPAPFKRVAEVVPEGILEAIPESDLQEVGWKALSLLRPARDAEKNSASPSRLDSSPSNTPAATSHPTAGPDGSCSASCSPGTPEAA